MFQGDASEFTALLHPVLQPAPQLFQAFRFRLVDPLVLHVLRLGNRTVIAHHPVVRFHLIRLVFVRALLLILLGLTLLIIVRPLRYLTDLLVQRPLLLTSAFFRMFDVRGAFATSERVTFLVRLRLVLVLVVIVRVFLHAVHGLQDFGTAQETVVASHRRVLQIRIYGVRYRPHDRHAVRIPVLGNVVHVTVRIDVLHDYGAIRIV